MRKILEQIPFLILFLISFFSLLGLLVMIPVAIFVPAKITKPWSVVSVLTFITFVCAIVWLLLGFGC